MEQDLYYRKGDHVVTQESHGDKPSSMFKALTMYPVWEKCIMPRCDVVPSEYQEDPEMWSMSSVDDIRGPRATPPISRGIKRDKLNGTNRAELAVFRRFSLIFADFCGFSLSLGIIALRRRRFSQKTADFRRKPQKTADFCRNRFVPFSLSLLVRPYNRSSEVRTYPA